MRACMRACVHHSMRACVRACTRAFVRACMRTRVRGRTDDTRHITFSPLRLPLADSKCGLSHAGDKVADSTLSPGRIPDASSLLYDSGAISTAAGLPTSAAAPDASMTYALPTPEASPIVGKRNSPLASAMYLPAMSQNSVVKTETEPMHLYGISDGHGHNPVAVGVC